MGKETKSLPAIVGKKRKLVQGKSYLLNLRHSLKIAALVFCLLLFFPLALPPSEQRLLAVLALTFACWITEALPLPVTALLAMLLCVLFGILPARQAFAPLGNPITFLFLGTFLLARAIKIYQLDRRWVEWLLARKSIAKSPFRILAGFALAAWAVSGWMSNTATTATLYPLAQQTLQKLRSRLAYPERFGLALMLICAYASSIGGIATPVGTPANLIGLGLLREQDWQVGFWSWVAAVAPISVLMLLCLLGMAWLKVRQDLKADFILVLPRQYLGKKLTKGERNTLFAFGVTVGLWGFSGMAALMRSGVEPTSVFLPMLDFFSQLPEAVPALLGAILLFALPAEGGKPTLSWQEIHRVNWGTILLFASGLTLGEAIFQTGLAKRLGEFFAHLPLADTLLGLTVWGTLIAVGLTELVSNVAAVNILVPIVLATAHQTQVAPILPVLGTVIGCSFAFMLPISTPPNAIVYASGLVPIRQMLPWGSVLDLLGLLAIVLTLFLWAAKVL